MNGPVKFNVCILQEPQKTKILWFFLGALADGTEVTGTIHVPEIAHDTDSDDYVVSIRKEKEGRIMKNIEPVCTYSLKFRSMMIVMPNKLSRKLFVRI